MRAWLLRNIKKVIPAFINLEIIKKSWSYFGFVYHKENHFFKKNIYEKWFLREAVHLKLILDYAQTIISFKTCNKQMKTPNSHNFVFKKVIFL